MHTVSGIIRHFIKDTGVSLKELKSITGVPASDIMDWWCFDRFVFKDEHIKNLEKCLGLSIQDLRDENYLKIHFHEDFRSEKVKVSEYYLEEARSFVRSSGHIIKYMELMFGRQRIKKILSEMQVHPAYFESHNNKINLQFFIDLLEKCRDFGFSSSDLRTIAGSLFLSIEGSESETLFPKAETYRDAYSIVAKAVQFFDQNFQYEFKIFDSHVEITSEPHDSVIPFLNKSRLDYLFEYRKHVFGTVPLLCGLKDLHLKVDPFAANKLMRQKYVGCFDKLDGSRKLSIINN